MKDGEFDRLRLQFNKPDWPIVRVKRSESSVDVTESVAVTFLHFDFKGFIEMIIGAFVYMIWTNTCQRLLDPPK